MRDKGLNERTEIKAMLRCSENYVRHQIGVYLSSNKPLTPAQQTEKVYIYTSQHQIYIHANGQKSGRHRRRR